MEGITSVGQRLQQIMNHYGLNKNSFSVKIGLNNNSAIVRIVNDPERGLSFEMLAKIGEIFSEVDLNWLVMGTGTMFKTWKEGSEYGNSIKYYSNNSQDSTDVLFEYKECDVAFNDFSGDSMAPKFIQGDILLCTSIKKDSITPGEAYRIKMKNGSVLFRYITNETEEQFILSADNPRFKDQPINKKDIDKLYLVKGIVRKVS